MPFFLGNDINSYSMARAFHEQYGVNSVVIGKAKSGPNNNSRICELLVVKDVETDDIFLKTLNGISSKNTGKKIILLACGDNYIDLIVRNKKNLGGSFIAPYVGEDLMEKLINKENFYQMCEQYNIDYPKTFIFKKDTFPNYNLPFDFPVILKPSNSIDYWRHPFLGQDKVFKIKSKEKLDETIKKIFDSGYSESLIIQDFIPGDDSFMRVLTCYSDKNGKVKMMSLGHVLLEEHTPHGLGNHAAILNDYDEALMQKIKTFLEQINYVGFSNFDIKYDSRDGKYKVFEINLRQGRSNFYVTGSGHNLASYLVKDYIENEELPVDIVKERKLWLVIPQSIVFKYTKSDKLRKEIKELIKNGQIVNPLFYKEDRRVKRMLHLIKSHFSHFRKYKRYYR